MHEPIEVLIVGTEPPCPRCDLLGVLVEEIADGGPQVRVRHCAFDSPEALELGRRLGCRIGTAWHVAGAAKIAIDWNAVHGLIDRSRDGAGPASRPADAWTPDLDAMLDPCRKAARAAGYLMTPILVVGGEVVHHGDVPPKDRIAKWLSNRG